MITRTARLRGLDSDERECRWFERRRGGGVERCGEEETGVATDEVGSRESCSGLGGQKIIAVVGVVV